MGGEQTNSIPRKTVAVTGSGVTIGDWLLQPALNQIQRQDEVVRLEPKAVALLSHLAEHPGEVIGREALLKAVWPGVVVSDDALTQVVIKLRRALGDDARHPRYIETISKRGYRLLAEVGEPPRDDASPARWLLSRPLLWGGGSILLVLLVVLALSPGSSGRGPQEDVDAGGAEPLTISVQPFAAGQQDTLSTRFAAGMAADLANDLSKLSELWVIDDPGAGNGRQAEPRARYRVAGSVFHDRNRLRVHVRLSESRSGRQIWSRRFDRPLRELFELQSQISHEVVGQLSLQISTAERRRLARRYTRNLAAYNRFLEAQALVVTGGAEAYRRARDLYRLAIELDPTFARAYAGLALSYAADYRNQWTGDGDAALRRAAEMAETALQIDPEIPQTYWVLGYIDTQRRRHDQALRHLQQAVELDNSFADAYALMGGINTYIGNPRASVGLLRRAIRLRPEAGYLYFLLLGRAYYFLGDTEQARINLHEALNRNTANLEAHIYLAATAFEEGDLETAEWELEEIRTIDPAFSFPTWASTYPMTSRSQVQHLGRVFGVTGG